MTFTTPIHIPHAQQEIAYRQRLLLVGSCFSDHIAQKLAEHYFQVTANPFGTLYNPLSIARCLEILASEEENTEAEYQIRNNGLYHSLLHHGRFSHADQKQFTQGIQQSISSGRKALQEADILILTFGTAWVYEYEGKVVSNCHKLPASTFVRRRLSVEEIVSTYKRILSLPVMQSKRVIFTVSPIRHLKDGLHDNQLSKATLLLAIESLGCEYFPSYEIMHDELRDYRFYADDMLHPSAVAVNYILQRFADTYFSPATRQESTVLHQLYTDLHHRPLHTDSEAYRTFLTATEQKRQSLLPHYPWLQDS